MLPVAILVPLLHCFVQLVACHDWECPAAVAELAYLGWFEEAPAQWEAEYNAAEAEYNAAEAEYNAAEAE